MQYPVIHVTSLKRKLFSSKIVKTSINVNTARGTTGTKVFN